MKKIFTPSTLRLPLILAVASVALLTFTYAQAENDGQKILDHIYSDVDDSRSPEIVLDSQAEAAGAPISVAPINAEVIDEPTSEVSIESIIEPNITDNASVDVHVEALKPSVEAEPTAEALLGEPAGNAAEETIIEDIIEDSEQAVSAPEAAPLMKIAIIIDDMGPDRRKGFGVIKLDAPLTLAFLPYAERLPEMTKIAADRGHELMIHMPMEPENSKLDLGSIGLRNDMSQDEWAEELDKAFASFKGYAGLNNHMGSRLTQNQDAMDYVMTRLVEQGLYFVDSKTISTSVANESARNAGLRTANRDVFLDHEESIEFVRNALIKLEETAKRKGHAIAIGHPKSVTIQGLKEWIPTLEAKGIELVHASALVRSYDIEDTSEEKTVIEEEPKPKTKVEEEPEEPVIDASTIDVESVSAAQREQELKNVLSLENPE